MIGLLDRTVQVAAQNVGILLDRTYTAETATDKVHLAQL